MILTPNYHTTTHHLFVSVLLGVSVLETHQLGKCNNGNWKAHCKCIACSHPLPILTSDIGLNSRTRIIHARTRLLIYT